MGMMETKGTGRGKVDRQPGPPPWGPGADRQPAARNSSEGRGQLAGLDCRRRARHHGRRPRACWPLRFPAALHSGAPTLEGASHAGRHDRHGRDAGRRGRGGDVGQHQEHHACRGARRTGRGHAGRGEPARQPGDSWQVSAGCYGKSRDRSTGVARRFSALSGGAIPTKKALRNILLRKAL